jgi:hypothetical protein
MRAGLSMSLAILAASGAATAAEIVWEPPTPLTTHQSWSYVGYNNARCLVARGTELHVIWADYRYPPNTSEIMYRRSTDDGGTWLHSVRISNDPASSDYPSLEVSGGIVHVVWQDERGGSIDIYHRSSSDGGSTWSDVHNLSRNPADSRYPVIVASGDAVNVVWEDSRHGAREIFQVRSTDGGKTWSEPVGLTSTGAASGFPSLSAGDGMVYLVWQDARGGHPEIYLKRSIDHGSTWSDGEQVTHGSVSSETPSLVDDGRLLHLTWVDRRDDFNFFEVYYKQSDDRGATWSAARRLSHATGNSFVPSIEASGGNVVVFWHDERLGNPDIYYAESWDRGLSWSEEINLSDDPADSYSPFVAVSRHKVHLIWQDGRNPGPYNHDIFYQRGTLPLHPRRTSGRRAP